MADPRRQFPPRFNPKNPSRCEAYDIHALLNKEIQSQTDIPPSLIADSSIPGSSGDGQQPQYPSFVDYELYFDTVFEDLAANLPQGQITFSVPNLNSLNPLQNIVEMRIGSFYFPSINPVGPTDYFYYRRVYLQVSGVTQQSSVQAANSNTYHFEFDIQNVNSTAILLTPVKEVFYFQVPVTSFQSITFTFYTPINFKPIPIPNVIIIAQTFLPGTATGDFNVLSGSALDIAPVGVLAPPGIAIFFQNFTSNDPAINAIVNSPGGVFVTQIVSPTVFRIGTSMVTVVTSPPATAIIGKNRIAFPIRFTCLAPSNITSVVPTHM